MVSTEEQVYNANKVNFQAAAEAYETIMKEMECPAAKQILKQFGGA